MKIYFKMKDNIRNFKSENLENAKIFEISIGRIPND